MPPEEISVMRKNTIEYYERYLTNESFIQKFESQEDPVFTIMLHPRLVYTKDEEDEGRKLYNELQSNPNLSIPSKPGIKQRIIEEIKQ